MKVKEICEYGIKSKVKAGEGLTEGKYKFFTSSAEANKFVNEYQFDKPGIIMGTGGNATLHYCDTPFSVSTDCVVLFPKDILITKYLYYFFRGNFHILENGFKGAGLKHTSKKYINEIKIKKIPIQGTQIQIIGVLDNIEDIITRKKQQLLEYDQLIKSRFVEMFGNPIINEKNHEKAKLKELGLLNRGKSKHRPRNAPELLGGIYPLIQTGDISNSDLYIKEYNSTYSELGLQQSKMWNKGTLCITIAANIAKTGILDFDACFPDSVVGFIPNIRTNNIYIHYWFTFFQEILENQAPESAQKNINLKILGELDVIVPPKEQKDIFASFVEQVDKLKFEVLKLLGELR